MRILFIVPEVAPFAGGGGPVYYTAFARALRSLGHTVKIMSGVYPEFKGRLNPEIDHYVLMRCPFRVKGADIRAYMPPTPQSAVALYRRMRRTDFDIAHIFGYGFTFVDLAARFLKIPYIATIMGAPNTPLLRGGVIKFGFALYNRFSGWPTLKTAAALHSLSFGCMNHPDLKKFRNITTAIGCGVDPPGDVPDDDHADHDHDQDVPEHFMLSVGRIQYSKGFQTVIRVLPAFPEMHYVIVGNDVGYEDTLRELATAKGVSDRVHFMGFLRQSRLESLFRRARLVLIPSLFEPFGLVSLEAMIRGKIVVASSVEGLAETITDGVDGFLAMADDEADYVRTIKRALAAPTDISQNARNRALEQTWSHVASIFEGLYSEVVRRGKKNEGPHKCFKGNEPEMVAERGATT